MRAADSGGRGWRGSNPRLTRGWPGVSGAGRGPEGVRRPERVRLPICTRLAAFLDDANRYVIIFFHQFQFHINTN